MSSSVLALEADQLSKVFHPHGKHPVTALNGLTFAVPRGEIFGLLGPNGAGKTTFLRIATTLIRPTGGTLRIFGADPVTDELAVRRQICAVLQENAVEVFLSVEDNLRTYARFHSIAQNDLDKKIDGALDLFGLHEHRKVRAIDLSGGLKRRVQVAKVFMTDRPLVFLDEATTGMDAINKRATLDALREEATRGRTIVLTTHILEEAEELCNRIAIIDRGRCVAIGDTTTIKALGAPVTQIHVTFDSVPDNADERLASLGAREWKRNGATIDIALDRTRMSPLHVLATLESFGQVVNLEVSSGTLEDALLRVLAKEDRP
jgi:ABC-2 type transport system ATP-binding protein